MTTPTLEGGTPGSLLDDHIEPFLKHLRAAGYAGLQRPNSQDCASAADTLLQDYKNHLRKDRGLTENSVLVDAPFIRDFLASQTAQSGRVSPDLFDTLIVRDFILEHTVDRSKEYARLLCTALRSFFRFLLLCGQTTRDLLLARLGLRGGEVVTGSSWPYCTALAQAGVRRSGRGAAHLFRHGLATKMIRHGASMSEIAEALRHRSLTTTAIYAQVSFEILHAVALPWPTSSSLQNLPSVGRWSQNLCNALHGHAGSAW